LLGIGVGTGLACAPPLVVVVCPGFVSSGVADVTGVAETFSVAIDDGVALVAFDAVRSIGGVTGVGFLETSAVTPAPRMRSAASPPSA
jgi:hypothetical protein